MREKGQVQLRVYWLEMYWLGTGGASVRWAMGYVCALERPRPRSGINDKR
jgi:hypothetical protein